MLQYFQTFKLYVNINKTNNKFTTTQSCHARAQDINLMFLLTKQTKAFTTSVTNTGCIKLN